MKANSRSPWADWCRFMKSMSISDHGRSRLNCVCRWTQRLAQVESGPAIHILAGENVCIQAMTPTQSGDASASRRIAAIPSGVVTTGLATIVIGDVVGVVEVRGDGARVLVDALEDGVAVEVLAAGDEPEPRGAGGPCSSLRFSSGHREYEREHTIACAARARNPMPAVVACLVPVGRLRRPHLTAPLSRPDT